MKNDDRILKLLAEALQRLDRHVEQFKRNDERFKRNDELFKENTERFDRTQEEIKRLREEQEQQWQEQQSRWEEQIAINCVLRAKVQAHDQRLDDQAGSISALWERTEYMHQSSLEQVKTYRKISQLIVAHNRALVDKSIL